VVVLRDIPEIQLPRPDDYIIPGRRGITFNSGGSLDLKGMEFRNTASCKI
jgi:hypothetical protein